MRKYLLLAFFLLSGCVIINDDRLQKVDTFPTVPSEDKVVVKIIIDENIYQEFQNIETYRNNIIFKEKEIAKERFEKSNLFKSVLVDEGDSDYVITIKSFRDLRLFDGRICELTTPVITGFTYLIIPSLLFLDTISP